MKFCQKIPLPHLKRLDVVFDESYFWNLVACFFCPTVYILKTEAMVLAVDIFRSVTMLPSHRQTPTAKAASSCLEQMPHSRPSERPSVFLGEIVALFFPLVIVDYPMLK